MPAIILSNPSGTLSNDIKGVWWFLTREDYTKDGKKRINQ